MSYYEADFTYMLRRHENVLHASQITAADTRYQELVHLNTPNHIEIILPAAVNRTLLTHSYERLTPEALFVGDITHDEVLKKWLSDAFNNRWAGKPLPPTQTLWIER